MAKKWNEYTAREKVIGVVVAVGAVIGISGFANAAGGSTSTVQPSTTPSSESSETASQPVSTTKEVTETSTIPFSKTTVDDNTLAQGTTKVTTAGVDGITTKTYTVTYIDDKETARSLKSEIVTTQPVTEVTNIGTYVAPKQNCDSNYSNACVPIASDVDCSGGSGNGPAYVRGPVYVVGNDIYRLDNDGDGVGCE